MHGILPGDAGTDPLPVDIKTLSYRLSTGKFEVTFKAEFHNAISDWHNGGFIIHVDEDMDPSNGEYIGSNTSMRADRSFIVLNVNGTWYPSLQAADTTLSGPAFYVRVNVVDSYSVDITFPIEDLDGDANGKFNMVWMGARANSSGQVTNTDYVPETTYLTLNILPVTNIGSIDAGGSVSIYPNPAAKTVNFHFGETQPAKITIYDMTGRVVAQKNTAEKNVSLVVEQLNNGMYIYHSTDLAGRILSKGSFNVVH